MTKIDTAVLWAVAYFAALVGLAARVAWLLYGDAEPPPDDPLMLVSWHRKRTWTLIAEFAAAPAFATGWTAVALWWPIAPPLMVLGCMSSGALGFGFLLHALQIVVLRRANNA